MNLEHDLLELAAKFINSTNQHIFLTGKAGTGKTTFLKDLAIKTHKNFLIVAPTGIAALNAKGTTIHSQFQLPFGSFIPENKPAGNYGDSVKLYSQYSLIRFHPINSMRKQVLRSTELLIIDEVSMLRADVLDAIDFRLRSARRNYNQSFGGVQVLMIGDLYQLPPIVKDAEWKILKSFYRCMHFFEAHALRNSGMISIELTKIFRQEDDTFINVLNNLRNNCITDDDVRILNNSVKSDEEIQSVKEVIRLTTHNYKADAINTKKLKALEGVLYEFEASIEGDFPDNLFPMPHKLKLKEGAQVMFIRNDTGDEKQFYNGSLGIIEAIVEGEIKVKLFDTEEIIKVEKQNWDNKKYLVDDTTKELIEHIEGTFTQFPIKLAWAVTIHKSQGLTFDKAIIDIEDAFAPGQVYVALSRLRSLQGLLLHGKIKKSSVQTDTDVVSFSKNKSIPTQLPEALMRGQEAYLSNLLHHAFDFTGIQKQISAVRNKQAAKMEFEDEVMQKALDIIEQNMFKEEDNCRIYVRQLSGLLSSKKYDQLVQRLSRGWEYYIKFLEDNLRQILVHICDVEQFSRTKTYANALKEIDQLIMQAIYNLDKSIHVIKCVLNKQSITKPMNAITSRVQFRQSLIEEIRKQAELKPKNTKNVSGRKKKSKSGNKKKAKGSTYEATFKLLNEGKDINEIANERNLTVNTIEGHVAKGIQSGKLDIETFLNKSAVDEIKAGYNTKSTGLKEWYAGLNGKYSYGKIRMVQAYLMAEQEYN